MAAEALYPRLLGPAWETLDEAVRRIHFAGAALEVCGRFRVWRAPGALARALCRLVRLPPAGEEVETSVVVTGDGRRERWARSFGGHPLVSESWAGGDGVLVEWVPPVELRFRLAADGGALCFRQVGAALRLGRLRLPLPAWCAPQVAGCETAAGGGRDTRVTISVRAPLVGPFFAYEGVVEPREEAP